MPAREIRPSLISPHPSRDTGPSPRSLLAAHADPCVLLLRKPRRTPTRPRSPSPPGSSSATRCETRCASMPRCLLVCDGSPELWQRVSRVGREARAHSDWSNAGRGPSMPSCALGGVTGCVRAGQGGEPRHRLHGDQRRHLQEVERPVRGAACPPSATSPAFVRPCAARQGSQPCAECSVLHTGMAWLRLQADDGRPPGAQDEKKPFEDQARRSGEWMRGPRTVEGALELELS